MKVARIKVNPKTGNILSNHNRTDIPTRNFVDTVAVLDGWGKQACLPEIKGFKTHTFAIKISHKKKITVIRVYFDR